MVHRHFFTSYKLIAVPSIVFISLILSIISCKKNDKDRYYNYFHGFSIKFPKGWIIQEKEKNTTVMAVMPDYSKNEIFNENINIVVNDFKTTPSLEEYNKEQMEGIKKIKNLSVIDEGKIVIDHCQGRWFIYSYKVNEFGIMGIAYSIIKNKKSFLITCIFENGNFENYKPIFTGVISTFRFEDQK